MKLVGHINAEYLNEPKARIRARGGGGGLVMSNSSPLPTNNGAVLKISQINKVFMSSAAEAGLGALLINVREDVYIHKMIKGVGHKQYRKKMQRYKSIA